MRITTLCLMIVCAAALIGCSKSDDTASNSPSTTPSATTGAAATAGGTAGATADTAGSTAGATTSADDSGSGNSLVGTWDMTNNTAAPTTYEFKDDGTFTNTVTSAAQKMTIVSTGTYKVDGDKMTQTITGITASSDDPAQKDNIDKANASYAEAVKKIPPVAGTLTWKDKGDAVWTADQNGKKMEVDLKKKDE